MATLKELRDVRLEKLNKLRQMGIDPYPAISNRDTSAESIVSDFEKLEGNKVTVAGRIMAMREHGKVAFMDVMDSTDRIQLYVKEANISSPNYSYSEIGFSDLDLLDVGDFVEGTGTVAKTQTGEPSVEVTKLRLLTKSLRPLPEKHEGLKDKETRMRRRYLDTTMNREVFERFARRAKFWEAHRDFLSERGFLEINIPVLEHIPGGADATPFETHMEAIDQKFFLRISHELYLKRLIGGGYEKVYEIGPRFRNEGLSDEHLPEHIAMEFYWAYADWEDGMQLIEDLFTYVIDKVYDGKKVFEIRGHTVDFSKDWERIDFAQIMAEKYDGLDVHNATLEEVSTLLKKHNIKGEFDENIHRGIDNLWKAIRKDITGPAFLINHPKYLSPLSKSKVDSPHITERCQPIIAGSELGNGWSELNDPLDQLERFSAQQELRDSGDEEAQWLDIDYVEMLEYGMPPTFGWGHSERVFWFLEDVPAREGVPFPQLKFELSDSTKEIYGETLKTVIDQMEEANRVEIDSDLSGLPTRNEAHELLKKHVADEYQRHHSEMVARALEAYAKKLGENEDLWYITGLLHDLDYFEHPDKHPQVELEWYKEWGYPQELIHAVEAHYHVPGGVEPQTKLAAALLATDELVGFLYAYSLMRPEGFKGMKASSVKKKFKDKAFAAKISREDIVDGVEAFGVDFGDHITFLIEVYN